MELLRDSHGRILSDLRVSITDRCNLRCLYCFPEESAANFEDRKATSSLNPLLTERVLRSELLSFEEIERVVRLITELGIQKVRLTGGEPLVRQDVELLVARLATLPGVADFALTTNGLLFQQKARALKKAGLPRVSFSLDSMDRANYQKITGRDSLPMVLESIALARELGFNPVKINAVIIRGLNDHEVEALAGFAREHDLAVRFIEFMPLDSAHSWRPELVVPASEILQRISSRYVLLPVPPAKPSETAKRWRFMGGGEIGIIPSVTQPFCQTCSRLRLTADGKIRTCLFSRVEFDLRCRLRDGTSDKALKACLREWVLQKEASHKIGQEPSPASRTMNRIGG